MRGQSTSLLLILDEGGGRKVTPGGVGSDVAFGAFAEGANFFKSSAASWAPTWLAVPPFDEPSMISDGWAEAFCVRCQSASPER